MAILANWGGGGLTSLEYEHLAHARVPSLYIMREILSIVYCNLLI
jgi:hypothetical protein